MVQRILIPQKMANDKMENDEKQKSEDVLILEPTKSDVILNRKLFNNHPGNQYYRNIIQLKRQRYLQTKKNRVKSKIAEEVLKKIKMQDPPGRFLRQTTHNDRWSEQEEAKTIRKIKMALRDSHPIKKEYESSSSCHTRTNSDTLCRKVGEKIEALLEIHFKDQNKLIDERIGMALNEKIGSKFKDEAEPHQSERISRSLIENKDIGRSNDLPTRTTTRRRKRAADDDISEVLNNKRMKCNDKNTTIEMMRFVRNSIVIGLCALKFIS